MRPLIPGLACLVSTLSLLGCGADTPTQSPTATPPSPIDGPALAQGPGQNVDALGVYWLSPDPTDPLAATLTPARTGEALGDLYALSVRPFMGSEHLQLLGAAAGPDNTTDYTIQFTHPIPMPADLARPATQTKRVDLFLFDVNVLLVVPGPDTFFDGTIRTNPAAMPNADGYRMIGPMVDLPSLGITDGTNVFPYRLLANIDSQHPAGNFDPALGWFENELLAPTGYDVVPQGANATTVARVRNGLTGPMAVVVLGKYQDPRNGTTILEKRANRLPDPANPSLLRYFLPEACGDLQATLTDSLGSLRDTSSGETVTISGNILDWDNAATVASAYPNHFDLTQIQRDSRPAQVQADFPQLWATGTFPATLGTSTGDLKEQVPLTLSVNNVDQSYVVSNPAGEDLYGLLRIRDTQDSASPAPVVLDESLVSRSMPGFELSTRFQRLTVHMNPGTVPPELGEVTPLTARPGGEITLSASVVRGLITAWDWQFDGGISPSSSTAEAPTVTVGTLGQERDYTGSVTVTAPDGEDTLDFTITTALPSPALPGTPYDYTVVLPAHYTTTSWDDGEAAARADNMPPTNPTTDAGATLGRVLFYDVRLSRNKTVACASCHQQVNNFADDTPKSIGFQGGETKRHVPSLTNARYYDNGRFFYDERAASLEAAVLLPIQDTVEMGFTLPELEQRLAATDFYPGLFEAAFGTPEITHDRIGGALAQFIRSLVSSTSKFDRVTADSPLPNSEFTAQESLGFQIFSGNNGGWGGENAVSCFQCHRTAAQISGGGEVVPTSGDPTPAGPFAANNGLDLTIGADPGAGLGAFKAPSLRNIEVSAPYMHDGRFTTLEEIVDFYTDDVAESANTHRFLHEDDDASEPIERFELTPEQRAALVAFMKTLTDPGFLTDPKFSDPFAD